MRVLFWYCDYFAWNPALKTLEDAPPAEGAQHEHSVVAFVQVEPQDMAPAAGAETKLVKNAKWLARKWEIDRVILHSFTHLGLVKAEPEEARALLERARQRLETAGYTCVQTPYGYYLDLQLTAQGHPLARIYKEF